VCSSKMKSVYCVWCCRRVESRRSSDARSPVEHRLMCMWHIGLHYLLPLSQMTAEDNHRDVLSPDVAGISALLSVWLSSLWFLVFILGFSYFMVDICH